MAAERVGIAEWGLPLELEELILANLSKLLIHEARTNPMRLKLMVEINNFFHVDNNLEKENQYIIYNFALNPMDYQPLGSLNKSKLFGINGYS